MSTPGSTGRLGPVFAGIWLFFLLNPLLEGWAHRDELRGVRRHGQHARVRGASTCRCGCGPAPTASGSSTPRRSAGPLPYLGALVGLGALTVACVGEPGMACVVYISVACVMVFPFRVAAPIVAALVVGTIALGAREDWGSQVGTAFGIMAAVGGGLRPTRGDDPQHRPRQRPAENARLAVDNERTRFARDLHDILGHSLTVITVKAELAQKLLDVDVDRARAEIADLERLSRDALTDVRRAVEGYRDITLPGELVRARVALRAAEIDADLPNSTDDVPSELRELFAWTVREGVTNVIRHSGARHCEVRLTADQRRGARRRPRDPLADAARARGWPGCASGPADVGATVVTRELSPGFSLSVVRLVTIRLLLADDQALVRGALSALLSLESDLEVVAEVGTGDAVVPAVLEHHPDVALLDVEMPGLDGIAATAEVRRASPRHPGADRDDVRPAGLPAPRAAGRRRRVRRQGHPGGPAGRRRTPRARRPPRRRPGAGHRLARGRRVTADPAGDRGAARRPGRLVGGRDRPEAVPLRGHGPQPPLLGDRQDRRLNRAEAVITADGNGWL